MTEETGEPIDPKLDAADGPAGNPANESSTEAASDEFKTDSAPAGTGEDGLPEWEPLTPELVEDEAIRGDFVIRWVVVGLALLLGISQIAETKTLVHLKNGQYLIDHGFLPGSNDVYSYTAADRKWINLPWLFDIAMSAIHSLSGGIGLSLIQGLIACLTFGLLANTVRPGIRTWWGSICAALALLASYHQITIQPELITLLGLSFVLWSLVRSEQPGQASGLWLIVPTIWLWAQLDQRAWLGWFLLLLWTAGEWMALESSASQNRSLLTKVTLLSLIVVGAHPFLWESWLAPVRMYTNDYPAMRFAYPVPTTAADQVYFPIWNSVIWQNVNHRLIASLILVVATITTLVLNRSHLRWSHLFAFVGINALSLLATRELAAASLVNCVICTWNAQTWYREQFGQVYSIDWRELLFSRGGRAATVVCFFALAWLILSGRIDGPGGKRTGIGFEANLATAMSDYENLSASLIDDRPFHFSIRQGDLMIWGGQKTFVDSRCGLFFGRDDANLLKLHDDTRRALPKEFNQTDQPIDWKTTLAHYKVRQALPRLNGPVPRPDYIRLNALLASEDFQLTSLNASTAVFVLKNEADEAITAFLKDHKFDLAEMAFHTRLDIVAKPELTESPVREFASPATAYDNLFSRRRHVVPGPVQLGAHFLELATSNSTPFENRCAAALIAIRHVNDGLKVESNCPDGYDTLGKAYLLLGKFESDVQSDNGQLNLGRLRYLQSVAALQQLFALRPNDTGVVRRLLLQYQIMGRLDLQLEMIRMLKDKVPAISTMTEEMRQEQDQLNEAIVGLEDAVSRIESMVTELLGRGVDRSQIATTTYQAGGTRLAIKTLEDDQIYLAKNPLAKLILGSWLIEVGRGREASELFATLEAMDRDISLLEWRNSAAISAMTVANYNRAISLWTNQIQLSTEKQVEAVLQSLPFLALNPLWMGPDSYPSTSLTSVMEMIQEVRLDNSSLQFHTAIAQLEAGMIDDAPKSLRRAIEMNPTAADRKVWNFYLKTLTGETVETTVDAPADDDYADMAEPPQDDAAATDKPAEPTDSPAAPSDAPAKSSETPAEPDSNAKPK